MSKPTNEDFKRARKILRESSCFSVSTVYALLHEPEGLRDRFAAEAMGSLLIEAPEKISPSLIAEKAFRFADAMMGVRGGGESHHTEEDSH